MIRVLQGGNVFDTPSGVIVCPTNTVGAMGAGLALTIRESSQACYEQYRKLCVRKVHTLDNPVLVKDDYLTVLCVATKEHYRYDTTEPRLKQSLSGFVRWCNEHPEILSVACPVLGGGLANRNGRLNYADIIEWHLEVFEGLKHTNVYFCV